MDKKFKKIFTDARKTLETLEHFKKRVKDIDPYKTKVEYTREWRQAVREVLLNMHCPERRCPLCNEVKLKSRQWVFLNSKNVVQVNKRIVDKLGDKRTVCLGCFRRYWKCTKQI